MSIILAAGYKDPVAQIACIFFFYFLYFLYIVVVRPFKLLRYTVYSIVNETLMLLIHLLFLIMVCNEDAATKADVAFGVLVMVIILCVVQLLFGLYYLFVTIAAILN